MGPKSRITLKKESTTALGGLVTPGPSFKSASAGLTPKREIDEIDLTSVSDITEDIIDLISTTGLPATEIPSSLGKS
jgi:hypothetical protein